MKNTGIDFNNKVKDGELDNSFYFRNFYNGGGVAIGDINNDSLPDVFLTSNRVRISFISIRAILNSRTFQKAQACGRTVCGVQVLLWLTSMLMVGWTFMFVL